MEDESGPINVIVKPDLYDRARSAVRMEPFLLVKGRLQKDGATMNVIAYEVEPLRLDTEAVGRRLPPTLEYWGNRERVGHRAERDAAVQEVTKESAGVRETWSPQWKARASAFRYLTALRQAPPDIKSFG